ncbi:MAG TPA: flagellar assembly protein FliX [Micropepsaceae bacterium]|nr:flagellar assembly protein FliX [Micropepsaceae bacterium]
MEIKSTRRLENATPVRRAGTAAPSGGASFAAEEMAETKTAAPLTGTSPLSAVDTILALQGVEDSTDSRQRGVKHGEQLLTLLDEVRDGLLTGGIPRSTLNRLALAISKHKEHFVDPKLQGVLDEIDLRARVELAKLEQAERPPV